MPIPFVKFTFKGVKFTAYEVQGEYKILIMPGNKIVSPARLAEMLKASTSK